ncbi:MAG: polysaccharide export protein [Terricaulis sp.]|nr:polysaccharide export protein [Terricaulis sp.]
MPHLDSNARRLFLLGMLGAAASACATTGAGDGEALADAAEVEYRLGPGDQLRVTVFNEPSLTGQYQVSDQGAIAYPLVGSIQAAGKTLPEFSQALQEALQTYIRAPNVSVEVANYRPFFILGEVQRPGTYPYSAHLTVQNAVATAGGFTYRANEGRVYIKHANEAQERAYRLTNSTPVLPGDTIRIGQRLF